MTGPLKFVKMKFNCTYISASDTTPGSTREKLKTFHYDGNVRLISWACWGRQWCNVMSPQLRSTCQKQSDVLIKMIGHGCLWVRQARASLTERNGAIWYRKSRDWRCYQVYSLRYVFESLQEDLSVMSVSYHKIRPYFFPSNIDGIMDIGFEIICFVAHKHFKVYRK